MHLPNFILCYNSAINILSECNNVNIDTNKSFNILNEIHRKTRAEQMNRAYKFRIYPNKEQRIMFAKTFGCVRFVYNLMLSDKIKHYQQTGKILSVTPARYKSQYEWLKEVDSLALANAQLNLQTAYKNFFSNKKAGFPKYKSKKKSRKRYTTNNQHGSIRIEGGRIKLPKVGYVKIVQHRPMMGVIKSVTVEQTPANKYFVSILVEYESQVPEVSLQKFIGLDFSMHDLYVTSGGERADYPRFFRRHEKKLARLCRWYSRRKQGSKNRERMRLRVCLEYERITNQRTDYLHKKSYNLAENYDVVCIETLNLRTVSRQLRLGKSVSDNSFGKLREMLRYKLYFRGKKLIEIDKWYPSSQICNVCGYKNSAVKDLSIREWECPKCGAEHDRGINAAINLREEGKRLAASTVGTTGSNAYGEGVRRLQSEKLAETQSSSK